MEAGLSRGRGARGRGRGRVSQEGRIEAAPNRGGASRRGRGASGRGKRRTSSQEEALEVQETRVSELPLSSTGTETEALSTLECPIGGELPSSEQSKQDGPLESHGIHEHEHAHAPKIRVSDMPAECTALPPPRTGALDAGFCSDSHVAVPHVEQRRVDDQVESCALDVPSTASSLQKRGKSQKQIEDFLMATRYEFSTADDPPREGARKRTKSRKIIENESLFNEVTVDSPPPKAVGRSKPRKKVKDAVPTSEAITVGPQETVEATATDGPQVTNEATTVDPPLEDACKALKQIHARPTSRGQYQSGANTSGVCVNASGLTYQVMKDGDHLAGASTYPGMPTTEDSREVCATTHGAYVNVDASANKRRWRLLQEHGGVTQPLLEGHGDDTMPSLGEHGDVTPLADLRRSVVLMEDHRREFLAATDGAFADMRDSAISFVTYANIEIVKDWRPYCPYAPFSAKLNHVNGNGRPQISPLPLFGSSRTTCTNQTVADYHDLVINAGGSVWALDWCPHRQFREGRTREFLAVGAHPYDSSAHKLGEPVHGKGLIQVWAFDVPLLFQPQASGYSHDHKKGRPKSRTEDLRELSVQNDVEILEEDAFNPDKVRSVSLEETAHDVRVGIDMEPSHEKVESFIPALKFSSKKEEFDLPQMVLGLAHDGGLTWDAKWQPAGGVYSDLDSKGLYRLGYLAVLFGNGSMQVFDVPLPSLVRDSNACGSRHSNLDPVVVKMNPVFKCSGLPAGRQKSMPLTLEWSSSPHDLLLVGCHDGVIALWKFIPERLCLRDTRPLACFVADSAPIRAIACAPESSEAESRNIIVTGGHSSRLQFWDIRDPFYPLWDLALSKGGCILSIDWLPYPKGIILSMDDGSIRTLSLDTASSDTPITGKPCTKTVTQGMHSIFSSSFAIWAVQVSRASGVAVYGGEDGSVLQFQLTEKFLLSDRTRAREPHFMCCKFTENLGTGVLSILSQNCAAPVQLKKYRADNNQAPFSKVLSKSSMTEEETQAKKNSRRQSSKSLLRSVRGKEIDDQGPKSNAFTTPSADEVNPLALVPFDLNNYENSSSGSLLTVNGDCSSKGAKQKKHGKPSSHSAKIIGSNQPTISPRGEVGTFSSGDGQPAGELPERLPPKSVSVHRIRWNQNKGCESWVCFGGAAGIVKCQLITPRE